MSDALRFFLKKFLSAFGDVLPIIIIIGLFQVFVIQKPFPNLKETLVGIFLVVLGLFIFIQGLESALFPIGERMANEFAKKGEVVWVIIFGFTLGFSTTIAEPALTVIAQKAGNIAAEAGAIKNLDTEINGFILGLRITIALSVGIAGGLGVIRIIAGWPLLHFIITGYGLIILVTMFAPKEIIGIAYDAGGITTSTITVPLITALGVGLASTLRGRNPLLDGFGIIALASLTPILMVMIFGIIVL